MFSIINVVFIHLYLLFRRQNYIFYLKPPNYLRFFLFLLLVYGKRPVSKVSVILPNVVSQYVLNEVYHMLPYAKKVYYNVIGIEYIGIIIKKKEKKFAIWIFLSIFAEKYCDMAKYINPFTDVGFKRIFGQELSKPLLLDFLNSLFEGEKHIVNLTFLDKEQPALFEEDRSLIYDIYCETDEGEKIIVEMQNKSQPFFKNRSIYYVSESIARQGERGSSWNYEIDSVYLVAFLNFSPLDFKKQFRTDVVLAEKDTKEQFSDKLRMIYLQLPLFKKEADECENQVERWIYLLKNMETLNRLPWAAQSAVFKKLESIADVSAMTRAERLQYDEALKKYRDTISVFEGVRMEGRKEGIVANARKMKSYGFTLEMISDITGLTMEEVRDL